MEIRPDAAQLAELAKYWPEVNHLYMVENYLRGLVPKDLEGACELSLTLTDTGAIMMVLESVKPKHSGACQAASMAVAEKINRPASEEEAVDKNPVAKTAKLMGSIGGNMFQSSVNGQINLMKGDINKMKSNTQGKAVGTYNDNMKSLEEYTNSSPALSVSVSAMLVIAALGMTLL